MTSKIAARKAELQLSNSGVDSIENNVISVCYLDAEDESTFRNFRLLRLSSPPLFRDSDFLPDLQLDIKDGWANPGKGGFCLHLNRWDTFQMKHKIRLSLFFLASFSIMIFAPNPALATQGHGGIEGVYAHEINNPLGIILGYTQLLLKNRGTEEERHADLKTIEKNVRNCKAIVEDLLSFARGSESKKEITRIHDIIDDVLGFMQYKVSSELKLQVN